MKSFREFPTEAGICDIIMSRLLWGVVLLSEKLDRSDMMKSMQSEARKAVKTVARKARVGRSAYVMDPECLALLEDFRLVDDDFMSKCLENAPECIELMLRIIIGKKDLKVVKSQTEYPIKSLQGRGVRFDVFAKDSEGREYDIEIQRSDCGAEPRRARYNSALMDANALKSGEDFGALRDTYVIFITENDVMGGGKEIYEIDRTIRQMRGKKFGDGSHIVYVNGATRSETEVGKLVHDLLCRDAAKMHFDVLKKRVSQFKNSEEGRRTMCKAVEELVKRGEARGEARGEVRGEARGKAEGKRETMFATAKRMIESGMLAVKDIAKFSGLSLAQVKKLQAEMA